MITLVDIAKIYQMGEIRVDALKNVNLHIAEGEYVAIMGASGSGKSTLMNILGCLDTATEGSYSLDGIDVSSLKDKHLSNIRGKKIGFVFQSFNLLNNLTLLENVEMPMMYAKIAKSERNSRAKELLTKVGLGDRMKHTPNEISGGQKQRVAIARALANHPSIILADEPTGNLDSKSEKDIMEVFESLSREGKTIIVVTHETSVASYSKRIVRFSDGEIISDIPNIKESGDK
ncbi:MAG: ABC transporter ATP-binding protein [Fusobacteria bacterium]|nr:ABC transporter ATP-binding protein [Fusobacteriota bacterium]